MTASERTFIARKRQQCSHCLLPMRLGDLIRPYPSVYRGTYQHDVCPPVPVCADCGRGLMRDWSRHGGTHTDPEWRCADADCPGSRRRVDVTGTAV